MTMRSFFRDLLLGTSLVAAACAGKSKTEPPQQAQLTRAISPPQRLEPPDYLPEGARLVLKTLMSSHAQNMSQLMSAIMVLDYPRIHEGAEAVASDASMSRPVTSDATELNSLLPPEFFRQQDALRESAHALADSAKRQSAYGVAEAYGQLAGTCVRCHYIYRAGTH